MSPDLICLSNLLERRENLEKKLEFLKKRHLNLFLDH